MIFYPSRKNLLRSGMQAGLSMYEQCMWSALMSIIIFFKKIYFYFYTNPLNFKISLQFILYLNVIIFFI